MHNRSQTKSSGPAAPVTIQGAWAPNTSPEGCRPFLQIRLQLPWRERPRAPPALLSVRRDVAEELFKVPEISPNCLLTFKNDTGIFILQCQVYLDDKHHIPHGPRLRAHPRRLTAASWGHRDVSGGSWGSDICLWGLSTAPVATGFRQRQMSRRTGKLPCLPTLQVYHLI